MKFTRKLRGKLSLWARRPPLGWLLGLALSAYLTLRFRRVVRVSHEGGLWYHRHGQRMMVDRRPKLSAPDAMDTLVREVKFFAFRPGPGDTIVDIGVGAGHELPEYSRAVGPTGRVIGIEAHPATIECARRNVEANGLTNVTLVQTAVTAKAGRVRLSDGDNWQANYIGASEGMEVPGRTFSEICESLGITEVSFLTINIEGAERCVVPSLGNFIYRIHHVCVSCHDFLAGRDGYGDEMRTREFVEDFLAGKGFIVQRNPEHPRPAGRDYLYATTTHA